MSDNEQAELPEQDWGAIWGDLPEAPALVPRAKDAQVTLRIPSGLLARVKAVASAKRLPYHAVARSWLVEAATSSDTPPRAHTEVSDAQLNLKLDHELLDQIKRRAGDLRLPYHAFARDSLVAAVTREEQALGIEARAQGDPRLGDLILLLLDAPGSNRSEAVRGVTRLQKLLFVIEQKLGLASQFYAYNYGPFDSDVYDAAEALRRAGFIVGGVEIKSAPPSFEQMVASVEHRAGPAAASIELFALTPKGRDLAERLRRSSGAYEALYSRIADLRKEWDTPRLDDLIHRVYTTWPAYAENSLIRDEVMSRGGGSNRQ